MKGVCALWFVLSYSAWGPDQHCHGNKATLVCWPQLPTKSQDQLSDTWRRPFQENSHPAKPNPNSQPSHHEPIQDFCFKIDFGVVCFTENVNWYSTHLNLPFLCPISFLVSPRSTSCVNHLHRNLWLRINWEASPKTIMICYCVCIPKTGHIFQVTWIWKWKLFRTKHEVIQLYFQSKILLSLLSAVTIHPPFINFSY